MYMIVDQKTGRVVAQNFIFFGRPSKGIDKGFVKVFVSFLDSILQSKRIAGKAVRLLLYMVREAELNSLEVHIIPEIATRELGISKMTLYRWLRDLEEEHIIKKIDTHTYRLTPYSFVKGRMRDALTYP